MRAEPPAPVFRAGGTNGRDVAIGGRARCRNCRLARHGSASTPRQVWPQGRPRRPTNPSGVSPAHPAQSASDGGRIPPESSPLQRRNREEQPPPPVSSPHHNHPRPLAKGHNPLLRCPAAALSFPVTHDAFFRASQHTRQRCTSAQFEKRRRGHPAEPFCRAHRTERIRQIIPRLRYALCRRPAQICRKPLGLCASIPRSPRAPRCRLCRRPLAFHRHRATHRSCRTAFHHRHHD